MQFIKSPCHYLTFHLPATTVVSKGKSINHIIYPHLKYSTLGQKSDVFTPSFCVRVLLSSDPSGNGLGLKWHFFPSASSLPQYHFFCISFLVYNIFFVPNIDVVLSSVIYELFLISFVYFSRLYWPQPTFRYRAQSHCKRVPHTRGGGESGSLVSFKTSVHVTHIHTQI